MSNFGTLPLGEVKRSFKADKSSLLMQLILEWHTSCASLASSAHSGGVCLHWCPGKQEPSLGVRMFHKDLFVGSGDWVGSFLVFQLFVGSFFWRIKSKTQAFVQIFSYQMALNLLENSCSQNNLEKLQLSFYLKNVFSTLYFFPFNFPGVLCSPNLPSVPVTIYNHSLN